MAGPLYDPFPKYLQIREILLRRLRAMSPGDPLPTENALAAEFQVSRVTMRAVLHALAQERIIQRRPRVGTSLLKVPNLPVDNRLTGPVEEFATQGLTTETRLAGRSVIAAGAEVAAALRLEAGASCYEIRRVRILDGIPLLLLEAYLPVEIGRKLARRNLRGGLMVPALREMVDPLIHEEYQQIDAILADPTMARELRIERGDPILCLKRLFADSEGRPVVFFKTNFRADRYFYTVKLPQPGKRGAARAAAPRGRPAATARRAARK